MHKNPIAIPCDFVESSNIESLGYDHPTRTMVVVFKGKNKSAYAYHPVTQGGFHNLRLAESIGKHFNEHFKNNDRITTLKIES